MLSTIPGATVAERIRWARKSAGFSQKRFAELLGTSRRHVMRWEGGQVKPGPAYVARIAEVTGQDPSLFTEDSDEAEAG